MHRIAALLFSVGIALPATAQQGTIKILVGFPAGASLDAMTRLVADKMQASLGQTVIVENRTGAGGQIAMTALKSSPADGTVLVMTPLVTVVTAPHVFASLPYDPVADFAPQHKAGKLHAVATSGAKRAKHLPEVQTFRELGYDIEGGGWYAAYAPAGTPANVVEKLDTYRMEPTGLEPANLARIQKRDHDLWGPVIKASGFKPGS